MHLYFVRIGALAEVQASNGPAGIVRDDRVVLRTTNGLQLGNVLGPCRDPIAADSNPPRILRVTTDEDELLIRRLNRHKQSAIELCRANLAESGSNCVLLDVDQMLDGQTLIMHFLGDVDRAAQSVSETIVEEYESVVRTRHFAKLLRDGCGPDCGSGSECSTGSCSGCSAADGCSAKAS
jgi:cell fate regulator YaaT (PSP1 superfamily)